jgi:uncharacterized membrane protein YkoI
MKSIAGGQLLALRLASAIGAFGLVTIGVVAGRLSAGAGQVATTPTAVAQAPTAAPGPDPAVQALLAERDAGYLEIIAEANRQLTIANERLAKAYATDWAPESAVVPPGPTATPGPVYLSPEQAANIALGLVPGATVTRAAELVSFQGRVAYEVVLDRGIVYLDSVTGEVFYNGASGQVADNNAGGRERERGSRESGASDEGDDG